VELENGGMFKLVFFLATALILCAWLIYAVLAVTAVESASTYCKDKNVAQCAGQFAKDFNQTKDSK
jgi:hypothetical protein